MVFFARNGKKPLLVAGVGVAAALVAAAQGYRPGSWIDAGVSEMVPGLAEYGDASGTLGTLNANGTVETKDNPFFLPLGTNGRACVTCHQPAWGMSVSAEAMRERWEATRGTDFVFAAFDGANCPDQPMKQRDSHSLLIDRGLFRIGLAWPPKDAAGKALPVDFDIEVVHDPTNCNRNAKYGLEAGNVNVYRRPRPSANLKYVVAGATRMIAKTGEPAALDPATGEPTSMNLMTDAREATLTTQALSAILGHEEARTAPDAETLRRIVEFESQVYTAQIHVYGAGRFDRKGVPAGLGPDALLNGKPDPSARGAVFGAFDSWKSVPALKTSGATWEASAARGAELFARREFTLNNTAHVNTPGAPATKGTCATCHSSRLTGMAPQAGWLDLGTTNRADAPAKAEIASSALPIFKVTCRADAKPHPFLGRVIYTSDPGRALISGRCADVGSIVMQQLRGLAARAPYFANGSAETLRDVVDFHNSRYQMNLTEAEKQDLVHFLEAL